MKWNLLSVDFTSTKKIKSMNKEDIRAGFTVENEINNSGSSDVLRVRYPLLGVTKIQFYRHDDIILST